MFITSKFVHIGFVLYWTWSTKYVKKTSKGRGVTVRSENAPDGRAWLHDFADGRLQFILGGDNGTELHLAVDVNGRQIGNAHFFHAGNVFLDGILINVIVDSIAESPLRLIRGRDHVGAGGAGGGVKRKGFHQGLGEMLIVGQLNFDVAIVFRNIVLDISRTSSVCSTACMQPIVFSNGTPYGISQPVATMRPFLFSMLSIRSTQYFMLSICVP